MDATKAFHHSTTAMRNQALLLSVVLVASYGYGAVSHAYRTFPMEELGGLRRAVWPERGIFTPRDEIYSDTRAREEIACGSLKRDAAVILIMGQSNAANHGETRYRPHGEVYNFDWMSGRCYRAEDPLLGATGDGGTPWTRLGEALVGRGVLSQVLLVTVAVGGTSIHAWVGENGPAAHAVAAASKLRRHGLEITHVLWQQGESDRNLGRNVYIRLFAQMSNYLRSNGVSAPIWVAQATICNNHGIEEIREAQAELPTLYAAANVRRGPDIDTLDHISDRAVNLCHFSDQGLDGVARLWFDVLTDYQTAASRPGRASVRTADRPAPQR